MSSQLSITNMDLYSYQYDENTLILNMENLSPYSLLTTQKKLSNEFIFNFILNPKYYVFREDEEITIHDILRYHPNFSKYKI